MAGITQLTAGFIQPAIAADVTIAVGDSSWMSPTQVVYIQTAGYFEVQSLPDAVSAIVRNLGYTGNAAATTAIAIGQGVSPGGLQGAAGAAGPSSLNGASGVSPTTTKGDLVVDNGANAPNPSLVRRAVGTDGQILVSDQAEATGVGWKTLLPNGTATAADTDNVIPRFNAASGNEEPAPLQLSGLLISDTGAIQSTPSGGDARGTSAVDLQVVRAASSQVASGDRSFIGAGQENTASTDDAGVVCGETNAASGNRSFIGGGKDNTASGTDSTVAGGNNNDASNTYSTVGGGNGNTASAAGAVIAGGGSNTASGDHSTIAGGFSQTISGASCSSVGGTTNSHSGDYGVVLGGLRSVGDKYGQVVHGNGMFALSGDAQWSDLLLRAATTNATPAILYLDGSSARATITSGSAWTFTGIVIGRRDNGDTASWKFEGAIHNNGGTTALIAAITATLIGADAGCSGTWGVAASIAVTADNANDALQVQVTGTAANNIRWVCRIKTVEVNY